MTTTFPAAPLVDAIEVAAGGKPLRQFLGDSDGGPSPLYACIWRAKRQGTVGPFVVDRLCVEVLGVHPTTIYGDQWAA